MIQDRNKKLEEMRKDLEVQTVKKKIEIMHAQLEQEKSKDMAALNSKINDMDIDLENNQDIVKFAADLQKIVDRP